MHSVKRPGMPWVDCSSSCGRIPNTLRTTSPTARAIVALARKPGPSTPPAELIPSSPRIGPFTTIRGAGPLVLCQPPPVTTRCCISASQAASTTGRYSGRHPAIAALIAACSTVHSRPRCGTAATTSARGRGVAARNSSTTSAVTGTTGSPSVQPCA